MRNLQPGSRWQPNLSSELYSRILIKVCCAQQVLFCVAAVLQVQVQFTPRSGDVSISPGTRIHIQREPHARPGFGVIRVGLRCRLTENWRYQPVRQHDQDRHNPQPGDDVIATSLAGHECRVLGDWTHKNWNRRCRRYAKAVGGYRGACRQLQMLLPLMDILAIYLVAHLTSIGRTSVARCRTSLA